MYLSFVEFKVPMRMYIAVHGNLSLPIGINSFLGEKEKSDGDL